MIKATALRTLGDHALADEVTQDTLIALARKARRIRLQDGGNLGPWLHRVAVFECQNARRKEERMKRKLQVARQSLESVNDQDDDALAWSRAVPILDAAIDALPAKERKAVVLRFFENRRFRDIGFALGGMSPDAVRMVTNRALVRLSKTLTRKGVAISAAALAAGLGSVGTSSVLATGSVSVGHEMVADVLRGSAERNEFSITALMDLDWAVRVAAFSVGLGIPVALSSFDSRSQTTTIAASAAISSSDTGVVVAQELAGRRWQTRPRADLGQDALHQLLRQIATLEDEYQDPVSLSEAMQTAMDLNPDQFQVVWEAVLKEEPPALLTDTIVARWAELDPLVALEATAAVDDGLKQARIVMKTWYQSDEEAAARFFESQPSEFYDHARSWFWHTMAEVDPDLGLRKNADRARNDLACFHYHYELLVGWFQSHDIPFNKTLQKRPLGYYPSHDSARTAFQELPALTAEQFIGPLEFLAGFYWDVEIRDSYLEPLMTSLPPAGERRALVEWVRASPVLPEDLRAAILGRAELKKP